MSEALIRAAQAGDREAFSALLEQEYDVIFRIAMQWSGVREDAEDIAQQACIKLANHIAQFRFESAFRTWLYRLVINCAKDWQQSQQRHQGLDVSPEQAQGYLEQQSSSSNPAEIQRYLEALLVWVASLGQGFKEVLLLVMGEGLSHREAAEVLDVAESTVSWRIHEIRKHLKSWDDTGGGGT